MGNILQDESYFYLNEYKDIVKTEDGYKLQPVFERLQNDDIVRTECSKAMNNQNSTDKVCYSCIHSTALRASHVCEILRRLNSNSNRLYLSSYVHNCDACEYVYPLTIVRSEEDMIQFVEKTINFFPNPESYETYYGFERKWDEEGNGEILETVREYYNRGGKFKHIPDKYPSVIYFGLVDDDYLYSWSSSHLNWIYCGEQ